MEPGGEWRNKLRRLTSQLFIDAGREQQRVGVLRDVGGDALVADGSPLRPHRSADQLQECRLSGSVATHQRDDLAAAKCQRDALHRGRGVIAMVHAVDPADARTSNAPTLPSPPSGGGRKTNALRMDAGIAKPERNWRPSCPQR